MAGTVFAFSGLPGSTGLWYPGAAWTINAAYRQPDGHWTDPVVWTFVVQSADAQATQILVTNAANNSAGRLTFGHAGELLHVRSTDTLKGEPIHRDLRFSGSAPVYPLLSVIPFHFPAPQNQTVTGPLRLSRVLNDRPVGTEALTQEAAVVGAETMIAMVPQQALVDLKALLGRDGHHRYSVQRFRVAKHDRLVFIQFWIEGYPWAVYTESPTCRAWLAESSIHDQK